MAKKKIGETSLYRGLAKLKEQKIWRKGNYRPEDLVSETPGE